MGTLLDVFALPRTGRSRTRKLRDAFLAGYRDKHPDARVVSMDLARDYRELPTLDEWDIEAKFEVAYGEGKLDDKGAARWAALTRLTDQLHACEVVLISAPMWNFSIPWHLKRWLDSVIQTGLTFEMANGGYRGLLGGRAAVVLTTRDGAYAGGSPLAALDHQIPYLKTVLGFMGLAPVHTVVGEPMVAAGPEVGQAALARAAAEAKELGRQL